MTKLIDKPYSRHKIIVKRVMGDPRLAGVRMRIRNPSLLYFLFTFRSDFMSIGKNLFTVYLDLFYKYN